MLSEALSESEGSICEDKFIPLKVQRYQVLQKPCGIILRIYFSNKIQS